ncbi:molybdenum cofactor guanylyltransferase [Gandjariella thermophila]|uniref:Molybdenum cofactor guanylyltransferase n=1 Tax=Gandjariella thermophila TaxID=1931992 RepID=A0A4D4J3R2_9PSEU|nr:NTP transferase domain-containing protein [Gandjariella thermophila]GDY28627.1 molybdenum cofactor guanylyltransferase [Gandjariella thermophila]
MPERWAAVVLAGGRSSRLGGGDKTRLRVGGRALLDHALAAVAGADPVVAVGPRQPVDGVEPRWTREDPPGGGPVAALAAGLAAVPGACPSVVLLAADQPGVTAATVWRLRAALADAPDAAGALLVDASSRRQWLTGVWRAAALRAALRADPAGAALRAVLGPLPGVEVPARPDETEDVDTPDDLAAARARHEHARQGSAG